MNKTPATGLDFKLFPKQLKCLLSKADLTLYGGAAGGGKSFVAMITAIYYAYNQPLLQVYVFRLTNNALELTFLKASTSFKTLLKPLIDSGHVVIVGKEIRFYNGATIHLCHCNDQRALDTYQGAAIGLLILDEAGQFDHATFRYLKGRVRIAHELRPEFKDVLPKTILTSNPAGKGLSWLKKTFVNFCPDDKIKTYDKDFKEDRQFIRSYLSDNPYLRDTDYAETLKAMGTVLAKAYLEGDWNVSLDGFFGDALSGKNVIEPFMIPIGWKKYRCFDWGQGSPFSVLWFAESNGDSIRYKGKEIHTQKGDIFLFMEYYGDNNGNEIGLGLTAEELAISIIKWEKEMKGSFYAGQIDAGPADYSIWSKESNGKSIEQTMRKNGCTFIRCDKARVLGWQRVIELLKRAHDPMRRSGGLFIFKNCFRLINHMQEAQRDKTKLEDIDTSKNDHDLDALRYGMMMKKVISTSRQF